MQNRTPIHRADDGELMGYVARTPDGWQAQTIFGYAFATTPTRENAAQMVRNKGLEMLADKWQYQADDGEWHLCVLKEVSPTQVTVIQLGDYGYPDPDNYITAVITDMQKIKK